MTRLRLRERIGVPDRVRTGLKAYKVAQLQLAQQGPDSILREVGPVGDFVNAGRTTTIAVKAQSRSPYQVVGRLERMRPHIEQSRSSSRAAAERSARRWRRHD
ncbi:MAG: hypothetical protein U0987_00130 [Afipia sp.]|nr:hypothetical protein [Afipia sp.]